LGEGVTINIWYAFAALAAAMLVVAGSASAASMNYTFTFDVSFGDNQAPKEVASDEDADFKVAVGGYHHTISSDDYVQGDQRGVDSNNFGLIVKNPNDEHTVDGLGSVEALKFTFGLGIDAELIDVVIGCSERWVTSDGYRYYDGSASNGFFADNDVFADEVFQGNTNFGSVPLVGPANLWLARGRSNSETSPKTTTAVRPLWTSASSFTPSRCARPMTCHRSHVLRRAG